MEKNKILGAVMLLLAAAMLLLPYYHLSLPSYFGQADVTQSGFSLVKKGMLITDSEMEEKVESLRSLIKDCDSLENVYQALGKVKKLVIKVKVYVVIGLCLPCILLILGAVLAFALKDRKGYILPLILNAVAFVIQGITGVWSIVTFSHWRGKLTEALEDQETISTGINFLDTVLDTASDVVAENISSIELHLQYGWYLFMAVSLASMLCLVYGLQKQNKKAVNVGIEDPITVKKEKSGTLVGLNGVYKGAYISIEPGKKLILGRDPKVASLVFDNSNAMSSRVSKRHCEIWFDPKDMLYYVRDFSSNGVCYRLTDGWHDLCMADMVQKYWMQQTGKIPQNVDYPFPEDTVIEIGSPENRFKLGGFYG